MNRPAALGVPDPTATTGGPAADDVRAGDIRRLLGRMDSLSDPVSDSGAHGGPPSPPTSAETQAKAICLRLLALAPRPRAALAQALDRREVDSAAAKRVLDRLEVVGLIDDAAYADGFVRTQQRDRALGRSRLRQEMRRKGVDETAVEVALAEVDEDSERARAQALVAARIVAAMGAGADAGRRRLLGLLERRGYSYDMAWSVVEEAVVAFRRSSR